MAWDGVDFNRSYFNREIIFNNLVGCYYLSGDMRDDNICFEQGATSFYLIYQAFKRFFRYLFKISSILLILLGA